MRGGIGSAERTRDGVGLESGGIRGPTEKLGTIISHPQSPPRALSPYRSTRKTQLADSSARLVGQLLDSRQPTKRKRVMFESPLPKLAELLAEEADKEAARLALSSPPRNLSDLLDGEAARQATQQIPHHTPRHQTPSERSALAPTGRLPHCLSAFRYRRSEAQLPCSFQNNTPAQRSVPSLDQFRGFRTYDCDGKYTSKQDLRGDQSANVAT